MWTISVTCTMSPMCFCCTDILILPIWQMIYLNLPILDLFHFYALNLIYHFSTLFQSFLNLWMLVFITYFIYKFLHLTANHLNLNLATHESYLVVNKVLAHMVLHVVSQQLLQCILTPPVELELMKTWYLSKWAKLFIYFTWLYLPLYVR